MKNKVSIILLIISISYGFCDDNSSNISSSGSPSIGMHHYYYNNQSLKNILIQTAKNNELNINFASDVPQLVLNKSINGRVPASSMNELLSILAQNYGFGWFINSGTLFITSNRYISKTIYVSGSNIQNVYEILKSQGIIKDNFGFSALANENKVVVSGPQSYVNNVANAIKGLNVSPSSEGYAVFRLKYAKAEDITMVFNGQNIIIPGVASILRSLNNMPTKEGIKISNQEQDIKTSESNNSGSIISSGPLTAANIQADVRFNTIIIRDTPSNINTYAKLISKLDISAPIIQIDVIMLDINQDKLDQSGIDWSATLGSANIGNNISGINKVNDLFVSYNQITNGQTIIGSTSNFIGAIKFLQQNNYAKTISRPSLATIDNIPAITSITQQLYLPDSVVAVDSVTSNDNVGYTPVQVVTALEIIPHLILNESGGNEIMVSINLQDGKINNNNISKTLTNTEQGIINSQVVIPNGKSILLSGYTKDYIEETKSQVPILGSIPLLGWFFKSQKLENKKITTWYIITPHIITNFSSTQSESEILQKYSDQSE